MKTVMGCLGRFRKDTVLCVVMAALEVVMDILLPFITAIIIDDGLEAANLPTVYRYGVLMVVMAFLGLLFGAGAGKYAASASSGLAANLREAIYTNIQTFSFSNIDKFSVPGLVTRMTTDITNVQNAFMMIIRVAVRAPLTFLFSFAMCFMINRKLSLMFLFAAAFLIVVIGVIMVVTLNIFNEVFRRYDDLNASVQENVSAIRVVKAFVREDYENNKFAKASANIYRMFVKAEGLLAFNNPAMMIAVYFCIISLSWLGAQFIVGGSLTSGELTSLYSYIMSLMMSLMMLSMVVVMITISMASVRRISEVLKETPDLHAPDQAVTEVSDGSIDFNHVNFSYKHGSGKNALSDIDLHIKSGETIGVIGGTGSGKSSLVNLICRLYDVDEGSLAEALVGADVFIGVSAPGTVTKDMVRSMAKDAIVFACANPTPEIFPEDALAAGAAVVATGRSDFPNQINNVLAFPGIFRGTFDVRARDINEEMKMAAAAALASLISDEELSAEYIIPKAFDKRVGPAVAAAVAEAARRSGVARI